MTNDECGMTNVRRSCRAFDLGRPHERLLMLFAVSRTRVMEHLGAVRHRVETRQSMVQYHLAAARREGKMARLVWAELLELGYGKGVAA